ncbi:methylated-DNA--[protein]-cysteine S-methyltransferase [Thermosipho atlanticus]|uniref:Methylated-DNA-[protein]-cysteine S-methyltransferase n=1 Tax=Thermosipho atlanticus DSM 15807 TaxID=1123380 RepID=A0A1M5QXA6_9BACT|nr:methylated-DNA--[protein]-cysteine S-methyltransferase [Thermosipho atlanticus]SHH18541.1 methylated-DNA-[protein]-cysteine S-methyltransferase [Thermosipho atlanticus DSM 15807]
MKIGLVPLKIGTVVIYVENDNLVKIELSDEFLEEKDCGIFTKQIKEYFEGKRKKFDFTVKISGGPIFKKIWNYVYNIPYGTTETYGKIAKELNINPRVIGFAMAANPLPIYIPCHRVVSKNDLGGFTGGLKWKKYLINLEKNR